MTRARTLTVLFGASSFGAGTIGGLLAEWVTAGFVEPMVWCSPRANPESPFDGVILTGGEPELTTFSGVLALAEWDNVQILIVHPIGPAEDPTFDREASDFIEEARGRLSNLQLGKFEVLNVLIPQEADSIAGASCLLHTALAGSVVVAVEDRLSSQSADGYRSDVFVEHAVLSIVTIGGLWSWVDPSDGPLLGGQLASPDVGRVIVARSYARAVCDGYAADEIARRFLVAPQAAGNVTGTQGEILDPPLAVARWSNAFRELHAATLKFRAPNLPRKDRPEVGPWQAILNFVRFFLQSLRDLPRRITSDVRRHVEHRIVDWAQWNTYGKDSMVRVVLHSSVSGEVRAAPPADSEDAGEDRAPAAAASGPLAPPAAPQTRRDLLAEASVFFQVVTKTAPTRDLWTELRDSSFAMVDGGRMPDALAREGTAPIGSIPQEVIVADPLRETFVLPGAAIGLVPALAAEVGREPFRCGDSVRARAALRILREALTELSGKQDVDDERAALTEALDVLSAWVEAHRSTFVWQTADDLAQSIDDAYTSLQGALSALAQDPFNAEDEKQLTKIRRKAALWSGIGTLVSIAATVGLMLLSVPLGLVVGAVLFSGTLLRVWRYQRRQFQLRYRIDERYESWERARAKVPLLLEEVLRLESLVDQYLDWADAIGWLVRHPHGDALSQLATPNATDEIGALTRPRAFGIANAMVGEEALGTLASRVRHQVLRNGWLGDLYRTTSGDALLRYARQYALDRPPTAEDDVSRTGPVRDHIVATFRDGIQGASTLQSLSHSIESILRSTPLDEMFETVQPDGAKFGSFDLPTPSTYLGGIVPSVEQREVLTPLMWSADGQTGPARDVVASYVWWPGERFEALPGDVKLHGSEVLARVGEPFRVLAARLDLTASCPADVLLAFPKRRADPDDGPTYSPGDATVL